MALVLRQVLANLRKIICFEFHPGIQTFAGDSAHHAIVEIGK